MESSEIDIVAIIIVTIPLDAFFSPVEFHWRDGTIISEDDMRDSDWSSVCTSETLARMVPNAWRRRADVNDAPAEEGWKLRESRR